MKNWKKIIKKLAYVLFLIISILLLFELVYRFNFIDFYKVELKELNKEEDLTLTKEKTLLIFGDSFSVDKNSYVKTLSDSLKNYNIINSSVPGTSVLQTKTFFESRVKKYKPNHIIIQLYVGNDLVDYSHPVNWSELSILRNLYWTVSDNLIGIQYLNYKLGQFKSTSVNKDPKQSLEFNSDTYNHREKLYFKADSLSLYNTILAIGNQKETLKNLIKDLKNLLEGIDIKTTILVIPHGAQLSKSYQENMNQLGAVFKSDICKGYNYPFLTNLTNDLFTEKVNVISPLNNFREYKNEELYYLNDPHLNEKGQHVLGGFLLNQIDF